jgi:predicted AAA+ superfamily ATPase
MAKQAAQEAGSAYLTLDDPTVLSAASSEPDDFTSNLSGRVVIDEVQRVPELLLSIKSAVDRDRRPGNFLLTGSANVLMVPRVADSLAGRMEILQLWPLSQGELRGERDDFLAILFNTNPPASRPLTQEDLITHLLKGGYPEAVKRSRAVRRTAWFNSYLTTILQRDVKDLANIQGLNEMPRLLHLLAARTSNVLNYAGLAREFGFPQSTLRRYMYLLEATYLLHFQPAWTTNIGKRAIKSPKILLNDVGLAASLLDVDGDRLRADRKLLGQLLESFVVLELYKQLGWSKVRARIYHFRSYDGYEVDAVLERSDGRIVGVEVKASVSVERKDFRGLAALQEEAPARFERGVVLHLGENFVPFGENLWALPLSALWTPAREGEG